MRRMSRRARATAVVACLALVAGGIAVALRARRDVDAPPSGSDRLSEPAMTRAAPTRAYRVDLTPGAALAGVVREEGGRALGGAVVRATAQPVFPGVPDAR